MNLDPFVGYLNRVHTTEDEPAQSDLLTLLDDFSRAYWRTHSFSEIEYPGQVVRSHVRNLPAQHSFGVEPFIPNGGEEMHKDAADWLNKVLEICSAQVRHGNRLFGKGHGECDPSGQLRRLDRARLPKRQACAGTGTTCPNKKVRPKTSTTGDLYCPIIPIGVEEDSVSLVSTIDKLMRYDTELYCSNCKQFPEYKEKLGRFWNTFVETTEILLLKLNRYRFVDGIFHKTDAPLDIPEYLDLSQYVEKKAAAAQHTGGTTAVYWLGGVISHIGDLGSGHYVSFVRHDHHKQNWVRISVDDVSWSYFEEAVHKPEALGRLNPNLFPYVLAYTKLAGVDGPDAVTREIGSASIHADSSEEL